MATGTDLIALIANRQNRADYQKKHWHGTFAEYLDIVPRPEGHPHRVPASLRHDPRLRQDEDIVNKEKLTRYRFFEDPVGNGQDAIFGLEKTLQNLVNILKSAAQRYGTERGCCSCTVRWAVPRARSRGS